MLWESASSSILNTASSNNLKYNSKCKKHALRSIQIDTTLLFSRGFLEPAWPQKAQSSREGSQRHSSREIPGGYVGVGLHLNKPGFVWFFSSLQFALPEYQNSNEELNSKTKSLHHKEGRRERARRCMTAVIKTSFFGPTKTGFCKAVTEEEYAVRLHPKRLFAEMHD